MAQQVADALHATALMGSPLTTAVAVRWIRDGAAERILAGVRLEARARRAIAAEVLPAARGDAESLHVWLDLPAGLDADGLRALAAARGLALVTADAFATRRPRHPERPANLAGRSGQGVTTARGPKQRRDAAEARHDRLKQQKPRSLTAPGQVQIKGGYS
jgi:DNA-binding transcriptional MocR family regulator